MSVDRYNVISNPLNPRRLNNKTALLVVFLIWLYSLFFAIMPLLKIYSLYTFEGYLTSCTIDYISNRTSSLNFVLAYFTAAWIVPVTIICSAYTGIVRSVGRNEANLRKFSESTNCADKSSQSSSNKEEMKIAKVAIGLVFLWLISWTPYAIVALMGPMGYVEYIHPTYSMIPALTAKTAATIDPIVYSLSHPRFKQELLSLFQSKKSQPSRKSASEDGATIETKY